ncbi:MAG: 2'-5' RNA ligase family protein [bacterium]|nr:2'-5' RNA ligase family protein [bacterium]
MPLLAVLAYPDPLDALEAAVQRWRIAFPTLQFAALPPHFTLVFPNESVAEADLRLHVQTCAEDFAAFPFVLRCALAVKEAASDRFYLFLVLDEGFSQLVRLHDQLYSGILAPHLRLDLPFIPHITVGYTTDAVVCHQAAQAINAEGITFPGHIHRLTLFDVENMAELGQTNLRGS